MLTSQCSKAPATIEAEHNIDVGSIGFAPNVWRYWSRGPISPSVQSRKLTDAVKVSQFPNSIADRRQLLDTRRLETVDLDVLEVMFPAAKYAEDSTSLGLNSLKSSTKDQRGPNRIYLVRVGRALQYNGSKGVWDHFCHGPRACTLEAKGFVAFANGADLTDVCRKWQIPRPPALPSAHSLYQARVTSSPNTHDAQTEDPRFIPKQRSMNQNLPTKETESKPEGKSLIEGKGSPASPASPSAPQAEDPSSLHPNIESNLVDDTKQVFARNQFLPMTFHVVPGHLESEIKSMIVVSPIISPGPRADQTESRRRHHRISKPSFYPR